MASVTTTQGQEVVECDLCQNPVSFFCRRCGVNLCDACIPVHLRVKSKTGHDLVDYVSKDDDDTCFCDSHPKHECSAFCKTCDAPICMLCVSIKHKSHKISELSDKIKELLQSITRENDRLQSFRYVLEKKLKDTTQQLSSLSFVYQKGKNDVTAQGVEWHKLIDMHVKKLHQELDDLKKENEAVLQKQNQEFEEMIEKMDEINRKLPQIQKSKNVSEMQKFKRVIKKQKTIKQFTQYKTFPIFHDCKLDENNIKTLFGFIGKIQEKKVPLLEISNMKMPKVPLVSSVIDTGFPTHKDRKSRLYDMAVTDDKKVWMGGESKELKLFDLKGKLHRTVTITYPRGMYICMYNNQVVFSDLSDKTVKKVSDEDTVVTMFQTGDWRPYGITGSASSGLLVCLLKDDQSKVVRFSSTGTVLQEIQYDSQCQPLYRHAWYMAENVNEDIIVTDYEKKTVIAVDRLGIFRYSYFRKDSSFLPDVVATDSAGQIFVTDFQGDKIHMLDINGRFLRYIIPQGGINRPGAVCMIGDGEMMVGECITGLAKRIRFLDM